MVKMKKLPACPLRKAKTEKADSDKTGSTDGSNIIGAISSESNIQPVVGPAEQPSQPKGESNITGGDVTIVTTPNSPSVTENPQGTRKKRAGVRLVRVRTYSPPIQIINVSNRQERRFQEKDIAKAITGCGNVSHPVLIHP